MLSIHKICTRINKERCLILTLRNAEILFFFSPYSSLEMSLKMIECKLKWALTFLLLNPEEQHYGTEDVDDADDTRSNQVGLFLRMDEWSFEPNNLRAPAENHNMVWLKNTADNSPSYPENSLPFRCWFHYCWLFRWGQWDNQEHHPQSDLGLRCPELFPTPPPSYLRSPWKQISNKDSSITSREAKRDISATVEHCTYGMQWQSLSPSGLCWWTWWEPSMARESTAKGNAWR